MAQPPKNPKKLVYPYGRTRPSGSSKTLGHYLSHGGEFGERDEAESIGDGLIDDAVNLAIEKFIAEHRDEIINTAVERAVERMRIENHEEGR